MITFEEAAHENPTCASGTDSRSYCITEQILREKCSQTLTGSTRATLLHSRSYSASAGFQAKAVQQFVTDDFTRLVKLQTDTARPARLIRR